MQENELIQNSKNGDFAKFMEWIDMHSGKAMRFAFQNGLSLEEANEVTMDTYISIRDELIHLDDKPLLLTLYKILLEKVSRYNPTQPIPEDALPFQEDMRLHMKIVDLDEKYRIPFILSFYHDLNKDQISIIIGESAGDIDATIQTTNELLGENRKSLEFLKKSYNRLSVTFKAQQIFGSVEQRPAAESKKKLTSWTIIGAFALVIIFISLPLSFMNKEDKPIANATAMESFTDLEEKYKAERTKRQERLKLVDARFDQLNFIGKADAKIMQLKESINRGETPENLKQKVENIIEDLKLPSEMAADIQQEPLHENESASIEHAKIYKEKIIDIITVYNSILWDNRETIEEFEGGAQKASLLMLSRAEFPSELQQAIDTMRTQSIQLCARNNTLEINACYYKTTIHDQLSYNYHPVASAFVELMTYDYYLNHVNMVYSPDWIYWALADMQQAILQTSKDISYYKELETYFASLFYEVMKGQDLIKEMGEQGIVPVLYQQAWKNFDYHEEAMPISYLVQPIVEEMEASDWKKSASWDRLTPESILDALKLAQEGKLEEIMFGKMPTLVSEQIDLPNKSYNMKIEKLYAEFKNTYDRTIFKELSPIYVVGVYDYANEMEDPMTMMKLFNFYNRELHENEAQAEEWRTAFIADWRKGFSIFDEATSIGFSSENMERYGRNYYAYVKIGKGLLEDQYIPIWIDKNGEFFLQELVHNPLPSSEEMPEMDIASIDKEWISYRYNNIAESKSLDELEYMGPIDVIATYFYAAEKGDHEIQSAFFYQGDGFKFIEKEQYLLNSENPEMKLENLYTTISFKGLEQDENGNWPGIAKLTVNQETNPSKESIIEINMMWTKQGWRIVYPSK